MHSCAIASKHTHTTMCTLEVSSLRVLQVARFYKDFVLDMVVLYTELSQYKGIFHQL